MNEDDLKVQIAAAQARIEASHRRAALLAELYSLKSFADKMEEYIINLDNYYSITYLGGEIEKPIHPVAPTFTDDDKAPNHPASDDCGCYSCYAHRDKEASMVDDLP